MDNRPETLEDLYAGWMTARLDLLRGSVRPCRRRFAAIHRRGGELLSHLTAAGHGLRAAAGRRDLELLARWMTRLNRADRSARSYFAAPYRLLNAPGTSG